MQLKLVSLVLFLSSLATAGTRIPRAQVRDITPAGDTLVIRTAGATFVAESGTVTLTPSGDLSLDGSFVSMAQREMSAQITDKEGTVWIVKVTCVDREGKAQSPEACAKELRLAVAALKLGLKADGLL